MIKNKRMLYIGINLLFFSIILNFPFPHRYPYGEGLFFILDIPIRSTSGWHFVGLTSLLLLIAGLYLLIKATKKHHGRLIVITVAVFLFLPTMAVSAYQNIFATGIYAVTYVSEESHCEFEMISGDTLHGDCELLLKNHSNSEVEFTMEFNEELIFKDDLPMVSLMNDDGPYDITLGKKESKRINIEAHIDVSKMNNHIEGGSASGMQIIVKESGRVREL